MEIETKYTDLTFFTNDSEDSILDRFKAVLKTVEFFDILVGYNIRTYIVVVCNCVIWGQQAVVIQDYKGKFNCRLGPYRSLKLLKLEGKSE